MTDAMSRLIATLADRYRIERELGQGGMATVYLAEDVKHDRKVALKVLRPELAAVIGPERFLAEIKTTANLQHPHILPLFDSGEVHGTVFYVMPFVAGESLRDRLTREKQLPVADAIRIASQVASALDYAHRHDVIHRDIKPENILLHDGSALVADFGIALAASRAGGTRMTETGMSLGTPHYMSPEQAMGERDLDARSDLYALGVTLYEMLGGEPPFTGPTAQAIVARVLKDDPRPLSELRPMVPVHVDAAVRIALHKLPADRFATAATFADALARPDTGVRYVATAPRARLTRWAPWLVSVAAVATAAAVVLSRGRVAPIDNPPSRLAVLAPGLGGSGGTSLIRQVALSPDGTTLVFAAVDETGANRLMRQSLDAEEAVPLALSNPFETFGNPVVSLDGRSLLASTLEGRLYRFSIEGGPGEQIAPGMLFNSRMSGYHAFTPEGDIWLTSFAGSWSSIGRVGVADTIVQELGPYETGARVQQVLPNGEVLSMMRAAGSSFGPVSTLHPETGAETPVLTTPVVEARYATGYLVIALANGDLQAVAFDPQRTKVTAAPVTIASGVSLTGTGIAQFAVAANGTVAYMPEEPRSLVFVDRAGGTRDATAERRNFHAPVFSPDGRRLSIDFNTADGRDVWVLGIGSGTLTRATFDRDGHDAMWTPDGRFLTYSKVASSGALGLYRTRPGSADPPDSLLATPLLGWTGQWLPDGSAIVTVGNGMRPSSQSDVGIIGNAGRGPFEPLAASRFNEQYPAVSPNQRWLAFASDQSGQSEVYVRPLDGDGDVVQVSQFGGNEPVWARDGRELFYRGFTQDGHPMLFVARIDGGRVFAVASRQELFSLADYVGTQPHANYDVSPDGRYFAMVRRSPSTRIMIIQNLPALVERLRSGSGVTQ